MQDRGLQYALYFKIMKRWTLQSLVRVLLKEIFNKRVNDNISIESPLYISRYFENSDKIYIYSKNKYFEGYLLYDLIDRKILYISGNWEFVLEKLYREIKNANLYRKNENKQQRLL